MLRKIQVWTIIYSTAQYRNYKKIGQACGRLGGGLWDGGGGGDGVEWEI